MRYGKQILQKDKVREETGEDGHKNIPCLCALYTMWLWLLLPCGRACDHIGNDATWILSLRHKRQHSFNLVLLWYWPLGPWDTMWTSECPETAVFCGSPNHMQRPQDVLATVPALFQMTASISCWACVWRQPWTIAGPGFRLPLAFVSS